MRPRTLFRVSGALRRLAISLEVASTAALWVWSWHRTFAEAVVTVVLGGLSLLSWSGWSECTPKMVLTKSLHRMGLQSTDPEGKVRCAVVTKVKRHGPNDLELRWRLPLGMKPSDVEGYLDSMRHHWNADVQVWGTDHQLTMRVRDNPIPERIDAEEFFIQQPRGTYGFSVGVGASHGGTLFADLASDVHLLVAGLPGSGKSVWLRQMLTRLCLENDPGEVRIIGIDLKRGMDFRFLSEAPHLCGRVVTTAEEERDALAWVAADLNERLDAMHAAGVTDVEGLRLKVPGTWPRTLVVVDELAELTTIEYLDDKAARAEQRAAIGHLQTIARLGRAAGFHLVLCTQRPDADVVPGQLKANLSTTVAFRVRSKLNSRIVLDGDAAAELPPIPGRGVLVHDQAEEFQGPFLSNESASQMLARRWAGKKSATVHVTPWLQSPLEDAA